MSEGSSGSKTGKDKPYKPKTTKPFKSKGPRHFDPGSETASISLE